MTTDLDKLYVQYMGKEPPTVQFEEEPPQEPDGKMPQELAPAQ